MGYIKPSIDQIIGSHPICDACGSERVTQDAQVKWNRATLDWELASVLNTFCCEGCGLCGAPTWKLDEAFRNKRIRRLNDAVRRSPGEHDTVVVTAGVQSMGQVALTEMSARIATYNAFNGDNDPHGEHDFGSIALDGEKLFWKIDYFDRRLKVHSPDAANPDVTCRVLTIMLASEY